MAASRKGAGAATPDGSSRSPRVRGSLWLSAAAAAARAAPAAPAAPAEPPAALAVALAARVAATASARAAAAALKPPPQAAAEMVCCGSPSIELSAHSPPWVSGCDHHDVDSNLQRSLPG